MKLLSWNVHGLGDYKKRRIVQIQHCRSDIVVLQETKKKKFSKRMVR